MSAPYVVLSDLHLHDWNSFSTTLSTGVNSRLQLILNEIESAASVVRELGGTRIYMAGDLFHVRGALKPSVMNPVIDCIADLVNEGFQFRIIPGNHDLESKDSKRLTNATQALERIGVDVVTDFRIYHDDKVVMIPWVEDQDDLVRQCLALRMDIDSTATPGANPEEDYTLIIHAALNGVIKGIPDTGLDPQELDDMGYKNVLVGHYHNHRQLTDNVFSVGATTHQTWSDVGTRAGYLVVSDGGNEIDHVESKAPQFMDFDLGWKKTEASLACEGNYVRVKLDEATEKEIIVIRETIIGEYGALGCVVKATPKSSATARVGSSASGVSIEQSIDEWITKECSGDRKEIIAECMDILKEAKEGVI